MSTTYKQKISLYKLIQTTLYSNYFNLWLKGLFYLDSCRTIGFDSTNLISYDYYLSNYDSSLFVFVPYNPFNEPKPNGHVFPISDYASRVFDIEYSDTTGIVSYDTIIYVTVADDLEFFTPVSDPILDPVINPDSPCVDGSCLYTYDIQRDDAFGVWRVNIKKYNECTDTYFSPDGLWYEGYYYDEFGLIVGYSFTIPLSDTGYQILIDGKLLDLTRSCKGMIPTTCCLMVCCEPDKYYLIMEI